MTPSDIIRYRLWNQHITQAHLIKPQQLVQYLGAMQAQEYAMAKWAIGLRLPSLHDEDVEKAFNKGSILRTHLLRPTWHFVSPADIRWILKLTAPRVNAASSFMYRKMELTDAIFKRGNAIFEKTLQGGNFLTRTTLKEALDRAKIVNSEFRLSYLLMRAELDGIICSGPRVGKQFTYALLEERVPMVKAFTRDESLAELTNRYFTSRGPATLQDFVIWSGLTVKDAKEGIDTLGSKFIREKIDGKEFIFKNNSGYTNAPTNASFLMPDYDEYGMSYKDRSAIFDNDNHSKHVSRGNPIFNRMIIINGKVEGTWHRTTSKKGTVINSFPFSKLSKQSQQSLRLAENKYKLFLGSNVEENG